jgi:hypothetical protein
MGAAVYAYYTIHYAVWYEIDFKVLHTCMGKPLTNGIVDSILDADWNCQV